MSISVTCSSCSKKLNVADHLAGRRVKCPKCKASLVLPGRVTRTVKADETASPFDFSNPTDGPTTDTPWDPPAAPFTNTVPQLVPCSACGRQIAPAAAACPQCGSPNQWLHPEIQRFRDSLDAFQHRPPFDVQWTNLTLSGTAEVSRGANAVGDISLKILGAACLAVVMGLFMPTPLGELLLFGGFVTFAVAVGFICITFFQPMKPTDSRLSFFIDFSQNPPGWQSDDDAYWADVRRFFGL